MTNLVSEDLVIGKEYTLSWLENNCGIVQRMTYTFVFDGWPIQFPKGYPVKEWRGGEDEEAT